MASLKLLIVAFALLFVQAQAHPQPQVTGILMDIIKIIESRAEKVLDYILEASGKAFDEASKDPNAFQAKTVERLEQRLDKALDLFNRRLDVIKEKGSANTVKVIECVEDAKAPSKKVVVGFYDRTTKCMAPEVQDLLKKLANIQPDLRDIKTKAFAEADKVQACSGSNAEEAQCLAGVVEKVLDVLRGTPSEVIQKALDIVLTIVDKLEEHIPKCIAPNVVQARQEAIETVDSVTACIVA